MPTDKKRVVIRVQPRLIEVCDYTRWRMLPAENSHLIHTTLWGLRYAKHDILVLDGAGDKIGRIPVESLPNLDNMLNELVTTAITGDGSEHTTEKVERAFAIIRKKNKERLDDADS